MKFLILTEKYLSRPIRINMSLVRAYQSNQSSSTDVFFTNGDYLAVEETPEQIDSMVNIGKENIS